MYNNNKGLSHSLSAHFPLVRSHVALALFDNNTAERSKETTLFKYFIWIDFENCSTSHDDDDDDDGPSSPHSFHVFFYTHNMCYTTEQICVKFYLPLSQSFKFSFVLCIEVIGSKKIRRQLWELIEKFIYCKFK